MKDNSSFKINLLAAIVDSSDDAIISKSLNGTITSWNKGAENMFGYSAEEMIGRPILTLIPADRQQEEIGILSQLKRGQRVDHFETIRRRKNGELLDVSLTISPIKDEAGNIIGASKIARDITLRKEGEEALKNNEAHFRRLANHMPQIVWTARPDGYLDYYNEQWYEFTGFNRDHFGDMSWAPILHPDDRDRCYKDWYMAIEKEQPFEMEYRFRDHKEQRWRWFLGRALPIRDNQGRIVKWLGTCTDIDAQKRVEEDLRRANSDLEQFAFTASHDLQEPLRTIKIYSELLLEDYGSELKGESAGYLHHLQNAATRMEHLVRDLLAYTRVTKLTPSTEKIDSNIELQQILSDLGGSITEVDAKITYDPLPPVHMDKTHFKQLFQNLISNAIKYRSFDRSPIVHIGVAWGSECHTFSVSDNGIGINPKYKEHIFGLFKRLHSHEEYSGTGIGLAICQRIVERYKGRIWVESEYGKGSTFYFTLPV
jgi:PAS domain S-box-containing protein